MPGHWFPLVVVSGGHLTALTNVALPPACGLDESLANEQAMKVAVQRIQNNNLEHPRKTRPGGACYRGIRVRIDQVAAWRGPA